MIDNKINKQVNKWGVLLSTVLSGFMVILNNSLMNVSLPFFMDMYQITAVEGQWIITAFSLGMVIVMTLSNYLRKRVGRKKIFLLGTFIFLLGSFFGSLAWDFASLIIFRFIQGLGGGLVMPLSMILIFEHFPKNERGLALGIWGVGATGAPTIGPTIGGILLEFFTWEMLFYINIPTALVAALAGIFFLQKDEKSIKVHFDWIGFIYISLGLAFLMIGINFLQNQLYAISAYTIITLGVAALLLFIWQELRIDQPLLNIRILNNFVFSGSLVLISFNILAMFSILLLIPILIQDIYGLPPLYAGFILFPQALAMGLSMTIGGKILDKKGPYIVILLGVLITTVLTFVIGFSIGEISLGFLATLLALQGIGNGMINTPASTSGLNALNEEYVSSGSAFNNLSRQLMKVICVVFLSIFFEYRRALHLDSNGWIEAGERAIQESYLFVAFFIATSIPLVLYLRKKW
ncbi:DHA2 family efflux MFS transporter permease subunit [Salicibibacter cibarius]|uniref:DHA2 family efflux MFS transporter permease subunit n=1 Tax=Salicibibacter cibarius TaxID=2743000 RepID=A0A7T6Z6N9_9BACI|nr:DHA2 family efflux MFS transporter permease subunit [Salicibibacter cibarius]QQK77798.1 DHA2 family efflux MFS transporter permease subunit [Salicibibacter cibarius]